MTKEHAAFRPQERWEDLTIQNRFLFAKVMGRRENCLPFLRRLFPELDITDIRLIAAEKTQEGPVDSRSVRYDVYVRDSRSRAFTLEMQVRSDGDLEKRSRYYASMMDEDLLSQGESYEKLAPAYIVFICPFDLFGAGLHKYTFRNICMEDHKILLQDEAARIFLNTAGIKNDIPEDLHRVLKYIGGFLPEDALDEDSYLAQLQNSVRQAKMNSIWRNEYMRYEAELNHERYQARKAGHEEGYNAGRAEGLVAGRAEGRAEGYDSGRLAAFYDLYRQKLLPLDVAASQAGFQTPEAFLKACEGLSH